MSPIKEAEQSSNRKTFFRDNLEAKCNKTFLEMIYYIDPSLKRWDTILGVVVADIGLKCHALIIWHCPQVNGLYI
jgi:hypothetical protein